MEGLYLGGALNQGDYMKRLIFWMREALIFSGWMDREKVTEIERVNFEDIGNLWGIQSLYEAHPDLIGK